MTLNRICSHLKAKNPRQMESFEGNPIPIQALVLLHNCIPDLRMFSYRISTYNHRGNFVLQQPTYNFKRPQLPNNLLMERKRLVSTQQKLIKDKELAVSYQQVLNKYLDKKCICGIPENKPKPHFEWLLQHCSDVLSKKATSKVGIMFNGSAPFKSLNTEALTGLKPQSDVFNIRNEWVALV